MEEQIKLPFKKCSLGMKQRVGIAMALLGNPLLLILDEPINGLDTDGMKLMREILVDITKNYHCTVLISSHILGELEKIATHYGIIRQGKMIQEISAKEMEARNHTYIEVETNNNKEAYNILKKHFNDVKLDNNLKIYDEDDTEKVMNILLSNHFEVSKMIQNKIGLEEYYIELMSKEVNK